MLRCGIVFQLIQLLSHVLAGNMDASCLRYVLMMADFMKDIDWKEVEDFRAFASAVYPFLGVRNSTLIINFTIILV